jgi:phosphoadenosine phosphosulfate reductase
LVEQKVIAALDQARGTQAVARLNRLGGAADPVERLRLIGSEIAGGLVFTTSFGIEDQALLHLVLEAGIAVEPVTLDTGRLFPATYELWDRTEKRYGLRIRSYHPDGAALAAYVADAGINGFYRSKADRIACCGVRKVEPLSRALAGAAGWLTGLRANQSNERNHVELASWDEQHGLIKLAPLLDWTREQVADFCAANDVPINALHARGFLSIGCEPCTRALDAGEPERAGRWWWEEGEAKECGLHVDAAGRLVRRTALA